LAANVGEPAVVDADNLISQDAARYVNDEYVLVMLSNDARVFGVRFVPRCT
jgi:hypothetical protein